MAVMVPIWIVVFGLLASYAALCQSPKVQTPANTMPDAPSVQNYSEQAATRAQLLQEIFDKPRLPLWERARVGAVSSGGSGHFDLGHFDRQQSKQNSPRDFWAKRIFASTPRQSTSNYTSESENLIRRAGYAAASVVVTHDDAGGRRLNTSYLLRVLTTTAAHTAYVPYWRRPLSQPASDFGSTIGNDAGMKLFHEFEPGILQLVKTHEPKFVSAIGERIGNK